MAFVKFLPQTHDDYATVAVAARVTLDGDRVAEARVALGAAATTPLRATVVEDALRGQVPHRLCCVMRQPWWLRR